MARKPMSAAARKRMSKAAKARPRTKAGKFKKGGARKRRKARKPAAKKRRVKRRKVAAKPRAKRRKARKPAAKRKRRSSTPRNAKGQFKRKPGSSRKRRRTVRDNPAPFPLDLAVLNPDTAGIGQIAKVGAGVAAGMFAGKSAALYSKQTGVVGELIQVATPIALGYGMSKLGAPNVGSGMMAAGAASAVLLGAARLLKLTPTTRELGHRLSGMAGNDATMFLQDETGRIYVKGADGDMYRLSGLGQAGSEPLVSVLLEDNTHRDMEMLGRLRSGPSSVIAVVRDPETRELATMPLSGIVEASDQFEDRSLSGIVEASDQFQDRSISGIVKAEDQFADGALSGIVEAGDQFADRALSGYDDQSDDSEYMY